MFTLEIDIESTRKMLKLITTGAIVNINEDRSNIDNIERIKHDAIVRYNTMLVFFDVYLNYDIKCFIEPEINELLNYIKDNIKV